MKNLIPSVCIDAVFEGIPYNEACAAVKRAGISAIEFWGWWDRDLDALVSAQKTNELQISACCTKFISLVDPTLRDKYLRGLEESIDVAKQIETNILISQVGDFRSGIPREEQRRSLIDGLNEAVPLLKDTGITLVIEPLNELVDHKGYYLIRSNEAFGIVEEVASPEIKVIFDIYHQQISEGHLITNILPNVDLIGHFHAAGNPGRHELQNGEINYPEVFKSIQETGFKGYVGLEYWPLDKDPVDALKEVAGWLK